VIRINITTKTTNNLKLCYLVIVVLQCATSLTHVLTPGKEKKRKGTHKAKKEEKGEDVALYP